jgi:hypothetical protein
VSQYDKKARIPIVVVPLLLLGVADHGTTALAQSLGKFTGAGVMTTSRYSHTATLLNSGKVLIAGGRGGDGQATTSAELYDPPMRTFTPTGSMTAARTDHTATLLPDGKVLITGGYGNSSALNTAELYDPSMGTFNPTGNMTTARVDHTATLLADGRVLIGGYGDAELYDSIAGTFTKVADTPKLVGGKTATLLTDGTVLVAAPGFGFPAAGYRYDPSKSTFNNIGDYLVTAFFAHASTLLLNGKVLVSGGGDADIDVGDVLYQAELYDAASNTFDYTANMSECRWRHTSTLLPDGTVLIAGGDDLDHYLISTYCINLADATPGRAELYDPGAGMFSVTSTMTAPRELHSATLLNDGTVLITGGTNIGVAGSLATAEIYEPALLIAGPRLFSFSSDGQGQGAIWHAATGQITSPDNPAVAGEVLSMYTTSLVDGAVIPPQVAIGGRLAEILYFGQAPGYPGYDQVNFRVPNGAPSGSTISVRLTYLGRPNNEVTIAVR